MIVNHLRLQDFRNYEILDCRFGPGLNLIVGENAQGKTNVLEAVYSVCTGRSFRTRDDRDMIRFERDSARVHLEFSEGGQPAVLDLTLLKNSSKEIRLNRNPIKTYGDLIGKAHVIVFSPDDLKLVKEGPQERRRFMDRELSAVSPAYYDALIRYHRILKQRNRLLKNLQYSQGLRDTLEQWDEQLSRTGAEVITRRCAFTARISDISKVLHAGISEGREELTLQYLSFAQNVEGLGCDTIATGMKERLSAQAASDIQRGTTSVGPHRDDFLLKVNGIALRDYGSQGQHRSAALALKLSGIAMIRQETGRLPVVLLDDVMSELDPGRQNALLTSLSEAQIIMTSTDTANLDPELVRAARRYTVKEGTIGCDMEQGGL